MVKNRKYKKDIRDIILCNKDALAEQILEKQMNNLPKLQKHYKQLDLQKCRQDIIYHISYLAEAVALNSEILFLEYVRWLKHLFLGLDIPLDQLIVNFEIIDSVLAEKLDTEPSLDIINSLLYKGRKILLEETNELTSFLKKETPYYLLCNAYMESLLNGNRVVSNELILNKVKDGTTVKDIYLHVFEPVQKEIGRLWQLGKISVAQEHYCSSVTQSLMAQLYPMFLNSGTNRYKCITTCIGNELHEIGIRMVADLLEMDNWNTYHLGANTPNDSLLKTIIEKQIDLLGVSVTMTYHLKQLEELIKDIRKLDKTGKIKIMVGGYPFNIDNQLWEKIGADGTARQGEEAVKQANRLIRKKV
jgi:methanogenic corrinoid protein MtbC1